MSEKSTQVQKIDIGDLTENVTMAVQRALATKGAATVNPFRRIIIGIILDPASVQRAQGESG